MTVLKADAIPNGKRERERGRKSKLKAKFEHKAVHPSVIFSSASLENNEQYGLS